LAVAGPGLDLDLDLVYHKISILLTIIKSKFSVYFPGPPADRKAI
jgi:hypothetical protein